jgi:hypothetical protein
MGITVVLFDGLRAMAAASASYRPTWYMREKEAAVGKGA